MLRNCSPYTIIIISFLFLICVGAGLLMMPFTHSTGSGFTFFEALFTATSAVTGTGFSICDMHGILSDYGQVCILLLIQLGGLGILTFSSVIVLLITKKIGFYTKRLISEGMNHEAKIDLYSHIKKVVFVVLLIEAIGAFLLFFVFIKQYSWYKALFYAIFHSVSAFCNAGIALYPNGLQDYTFDIPMNLIIILLMFLGGFGFTAIIELFEYIRGKRRKISVNSKFSSLITLILFGAGTLLFFILEYNHMDAYAGHSVGNKLLISFFHSATLRSVGFNTIPITEISGATACLLGAGVGSDGSAATAFLWILLMFIGSSPSSTGGGIKTTTLGVLYLGVRTSLLNRRYIEYSKRRISWQLFNKASTLVFITLLYVFLAALLITYFDPEVELLKILFEVISAFSTTGLSMGITNSLSTASQTILLFTMFLGRVGPLTIVLAFSRERIVGNYKYPKEDILIG